MVLSRSTTNDCVPRFFSSVAHTLAQGRFSEDSLFRLFAAAIDDGWAEGDQLPTLTHLQATRCFYEVERDLELGMSLQIELFREIPLKMFFERASDVLRGGGALGLGYRAASLLGGVRDDLHVSAVQTVDSQGVKFVDPRIGGGRLFPWHAVESAVWEADSGFWIITPKQTLGR